MQPLAHNVFFSLHDNSAAARERLIQACKKYLTGHAGEVFFACGTLCPDLARPVNDREFDIGLHVIFESRPAHDAYQTDPRHEQFIAEQKPNWKKVRVFDSNVELA